MPAVAMSVVLTVVGCRNKEALKRAGEGLVGADDALKRVRDQEKEEGWSGLMSEDG